MLMYKAVPELLTSNNTGFNMGTMEANEIKQFIVSAIKEETSSIKEEVKKLHVITIKDSDGFEKTMNRDDFFQLLHDRGSIRFKKIVKYAWDWERLVQFLLTLSTLGGVIYLYIKG